MMQIFTLKEKKALTHDVFELVFEGEQEINMKPGQFVTFLLDKIGGRAYSVLRTNGKNIHVIIKKWETQNGGRGGSKMICEQEIGAQLKGVGPAGHFLLQENNKNKLFIGTGTGMVPLYNQILGSKEQKQSAKLKLIFGVRSKEDVFYETEYKKISEEHPLFDYHIFLSREEHNSYEKGYVTDFLNERVAEEFEEYYICGAPSMIDSTVEKLKNLGIAEENIFLERYA